MEEDGSGDDDEGGIHYIYESLYSPEVIFPINSEIIKGGPGEQQNIGKLKLQVDFRVG